MGIHSFLNPVRNGGMRFSVRLGLLLAATCLLQNAMAQRVGLGTAGDFSVLAGAGITNTGTTTIFGNVGTHPTPSITGLNSVTLLGVNQGANAITQQAKSDLLTAYNDAAGRPAPPANTFPPISDLGGLTLAPGVYNNPSSFGITGNLTLDGQGSSDSVWIFQTGSTLITASNSTVSLINGANACSIFWQVGSSATLGTGTDFAGTIIALTSITLNTGATVDGRVLALNGAVTLDGNTITRPICDLPIGGATPVPITILQTVDGGTAIPILPIDGVTATPILLIDRTTATPILIVNAEDVKAIMPTFYGGVLNTGMELSLNQGQLLFQQLSSRRLGRPGGYDEPLTDQGSGKRVVENWSGGKEFLGGKGSLELARPESGAWVEDTPWNTWVQGSGLFSGGGLGLIPGEDFSSGSFMAGADRAVSEHLALGLYTGYQEGWGDYNNGGSMDLESARVGAYAALDFEGFYASGAAGVGTTDYHTRRPVLNRLAWGDTEGSEYFAMLGAGYDFHAGNFTFGPAVSAQYTHLTIDGFTERGANILDLRLRSFEGESLRTDLGGRIAYTHRVNPDLTLIPEVRMFWQHEHMDERAAIHGQLNGGRGSAFNYLTERPETDAVFAGAGVGMLVGDSLTLSTFYHAGFGRNEGTQHSVSVSASWRF